MSIYADQVAVRIFHVDDHEVIRIGIGTVIEKCPGLQLVGWAATADEALHRIPVARPDVAILDIQLGDGPNGIELCREIRSRWPDIQCLMFTAYGDDHSVFASIMAGASGYLLKGGDAAAVLDAVQAVAAGHSLLDPGVTAKVLDRLRAARTKEPSLTERERAILQLIAEGATNRQIGEALYLAEKTVRNYVSGLLAKLGVQRRGEAAAYAARQTAEQRRPASNM
jgi:two-component system, NarL family, response regulator DevR